MKKQQRAHAQVVALFHSNLPCGACFSCLEKAVCKVFGKKTSSEACRHLWAVLSACVETKGCNATKHEFEKLAGRYFPDTHSPLVEDTVRGLMSKRVIAEAA